MHLLRFHVIAALVTLAVLAAFACFAAHRTVPRAQVHVAILRTSSDDTCRAVQRGIERGLADAGYVEGENITIDRRGADGDPARLASLAQSVVASQPDLIFAVGSEAAKAAAHQTTRLPIVGAAVSDYVAAGLVKNEAAPGTNVTGVSDRYDVSSAVTLLNGMLSTHDLAVDHEKSGEAAAALAARILAGQSPARIPVQYAAVR